MEYTATSRYKNCCPNTVKRLENGMFECAIELKLEVGDELDMRIAQECFHGDIYVVKKVNELRKSKNGGDFSRVEIEL